MSWYKKSQQEDFDFLKKMPQNTETPIAETEEYKDLSNRAGKTFEGVLEEVNGEKSVVSVIKQYGLSYKKINLNDNIIITVFLGDKLYVIDDFDNPTLKEASEWLWHVFSSNRIDYYLPSSDYSSIFWKNLGRNKVVYHATTEEYKDIILEDGLMRMDKTRGISNRGTGSAIFTSYNPDDIESYGNVIFEINLSKMKEDGYMPEVSKEIPIEESEKLSQLAHKIGLQDFVGPDYNSEGIYESTLIIYGDIPVKYLSIERT